MWVRFQGSRLLILSIKGTKYSPVSETEKNRRGASVCILWNIRVKRQSDKNEHNFRLVIAFVLSPLLYFLKEPPLLTETTKNTTKKVECRIRWKYTMRTAKSFNPSSKRDCKFDRREYRISFFHRDKKGVHSSTKNYVIISYLKIHVVWQAFLIHSTFRKNSLLVEYYKRISNQSIFW